MHKRLHITLYITSVINNKRNNASLSLYNIFSGLRLPQSLFEIPDNVLYILNTH